MEGTELTPEQLAEWERAKDALWLIFQHVPVVKLEKLATKISDPEYRKGWKYQTFINSL